MNEQEMMAYESQIASAARASQRSQLSIYSQPDGIPSALLPYCARTGPFFDWATRSCSNSWLLEVAYVPPPRKRISRSRRRAALQAAAEASAGWG